MKFYFSHPIRGKDGDKATDRTIQNNCLTAIAMAHSIRQKIIGLQLYVPGAHDVFVQLAYKNGYITEEQILTVDCQIIDRCDGVIIYAPDGDVYGGCLIEKKYAIATDKPVIVFATETQAVSALRKLING